MMRTLALVYHDVVGSNDYESSGFPGNEAARYKMSRPLFESHLKAIQDGLEGGAVETLGSSRSHRKQVLLTFDDGGSSAYTYIADALEHLGWRGHFLITTACIGLPGFMTDGQIVELHKRGHVIGSHSWRHPVRMADCAWDVLLDEWGQSVKTLTELLGHPVTVAALPGGFYS